MREGDPTVDKMPPQNLLENFAQVEERLVKGRGSRVKYSMAFYHTRCCFRRQSNGIGTWTGFIFLRFALKDYKKTPYFSRDTVPLKVELLH